MKISKSITILILLFSFLIAVYGGRIFPFSDYPMFSFAKENASVLALYVRDQNNVERILDSKYLYPLNRLHLHQVGIVQLTSNASNHEWIRIFGERYKSIYPQTKAIILKRITFHEISSSPLELSSNEIVDIYEIPL